MQGLNTGGENTVDFLELLELLTAVLYKLVQILDLRSILLPGDLYMLICTYAYT